MHFVGMVALRLPMDVYFEPLTTSISLIPAILAGYIGLWVLRNDRPSGFAIVGGGTLMGLGIGVMHYVGMGGMLVNAKMAYHPELFLLSILSAAVLASLALSVPRLLMAFQYRLNTRNFPFLLKLATASLMGLAISSLHYVAMAATVFLPLDWPIDPEPSHIIDETLIAALAVIASIFILVV